MNEIIKQNNWYQELLQDLRKLEFTGIVLTKWNIGKRLSQDELKFGKPEYGSKRIENLAKDLKISKNDIWRCIQFHKKFHDVKQFEFKSWHFICNHLLPEPRKPKLLVPNLPEGKYSIIYADPPWEYWAGGYKNQTQHYNSMSLEEICNLPVGELADDNCLLFMWTTFPMLDNFIDVLRCWGFEYSTVAFVWIKKNKNKDSNFMGLGNWTRSNAEICILGKRGSLERQDAGISQIIETPIEEHSKKPDIVRDKIIQLVGDLPRIELFARTKTKGWEVWGSETDKFKK